MPERLSYPPFFQGLESGFLLYSVLLLCCMLSFLLLRGRCPQRHNQIWVLWKVFWGQVIVILHLFVMSFRTNYTHAFLFRIGLLKNYGFKAIVMHNKKHLLRCAECLQSALKSRETKGTQLNTKAPWMLVRIRSLSATLVFL